MVGSLAEDSISVELQARVSWGPVLVQEDLQSLLGLGPHHTIREQSLHAVGILVQEKLQVLDGMRAHDAVNLKQGRFLLAVAGELLGSHIDDTSTDVLNWASVVRERETSHLCS